MTSEPAKITPISKSWARESSEKEVSERVWRDTVRYSHEDIAS